MFAIALLRKTEIRNLFFIFQFLKSTVEQMNEWILQLISTLHENSRVTPGDVFFRRSMVINTLGDDGLDSGNYSTSRKVRTCVYVRIKIEI